MRLGLCSIQKGRSKYILEWLAFHLQLGIDKIYVYSHGTDDPIQDLMLKDLAKAHHQIVFNKVGDIDHPLLNAYRHAWHHYQHEVDAMIFIDGDEFIFPAKPGESLQAITEELFTSYNSSAIGAYWVCFGSSGHIKDPNGLLIENYTRHNEFHHIANTHFKSILRSGEEANFLNPHLFHTRRGTVDELGRPLHKPMATDYVPSHTRLRVNHYIVQSLEYFVNKKRNSGRPEQAKSFVNHKDHIRTIDDYFHGHDFSERLGSEATRYSIKTKLKIMELSHDLDYIRQSWPYEFSGYEIQS
jgi:hypothetical protein